jgi:hypothetical protein
MQITGSRSNDFIYWHFVTSYILHNFQSSVAHTLGFSVFTSRLLATDLNTNYHFKSLWNLVISSSITLYSSSLVCTQSSQFTKDMFHSRPCTLNCVVAPNVFKITPRHGPRTEKACHVFVLPSVHWRAGRTYRKHITWLLSSKFIGALTAA